MLKNNLIIKTVIIFVTYLLYSSVIGQLLVAAGIENITTISFLSDLTFLIGITILYKKYLKDSFYIFIKGSSFTKKIIDISKWVVILFFLQLIPGIAAEMILGNAALDSNTQSLVSLNYIYIIFKVLVFSIVAEELVFRKSIRDVIDNKIIFIIVSSLLYAIMNIVYADWNSYLIIIDFVNYFFLYSVLSYIYVKYDNIIMVMLVKFVHSFIPLIILFMVGSKWLIRIY